MKIDFNQAKREFEEYLQNHKRWVLSTALNDYVTSRTMSMIHQGTNIYFQTNKCYIKHQQMKNNSNVALCCDNVSIEGVAIPIGDWKDENNEILRILYQKTHPSSYDAYGLLEGQVVYKVIPNIVKIWKYVDGAPIRESIDFNKNSAERYEFM